MAAELTIRVALADAFTSEWKRVQASTLKGVGSMGASFGGLARSVFNLRNAIVGGLAAVVTRDLVRAYSKQEAAEQRLQNAMKLTGTFTEAAEARMHAFASKLQETSVVGDETALRMLGVATAMGQSEDRARKMVQAAADLAAATGKDVNMAFQQLLKSTGGFAGELGELMPAVKGLTAEQLKMGGATDLVAAKFRGFAAAEAKTFGGQLTQIGNLWGDVKEKFGSFIAAIFQSGLGEWIKTTLVVLNETLGATAGRFAAGGPEATAWSNLLIGAFESVILSAAAVADGFRLLTKPFTAIRQLGVQEDLGRVSAALEVVNQAQLDLARGSGPTAQGLRAVGDEYEKFVRVQADFVAQQGAELPSAMEEVLRGVDLNAEGVKRLKNELELLQDARREELQSLQADREASTNTATMRERAKELLKEVEIRIKAAAAARATAAAAAAPDAKAEVAAVETVMEAYRKLQGFTSTLTGGLTSAQGTSVIDALSARLAALPADLQAAFASAEVKGVATLERLESVARTRMDSATDATKTFAQKFLGTVQDLKAAWASLWSGVENAAQAAAAISFQALQTMATGVGDIVANSIDQIVSGQITTTKELGKALKEMFVDLARSILREMIALSIRMAIMASIKALLAAEGAVWEGGFTPIKTFAAGGVVTQPTIGIVGEAGQNEAVVPLQNGTDIPVRIEGGGQGATAQVNITIHATDARSFNDQLAQQESRRLLEGIIMNAMRTRPAFRNAVQGDGL